jgi:hypothetical protein
MLPSHAVLITSGLLLAGLGLSLTRSRRYARAHAIQSFAETKTAGIS